MILKTRCGYSALRSKPVKRTVLASTAVNDNRRETMYFGRIENRFSNRIDKYYRIPSYRHGREKVVGGKYRESC
jgi:hypothetical protein